MIKPGPARVGTPARGSNFLRPGPGPGWAGLDISDMNSKIYLKNFSNSIHQTQLNQNLRFFNLMRKKNFFRKRKTFLFFFHSGKKTPSLVVGLLLGRVGVEVFTETLRDGAIT